jgi:hypothetical protein
MNPTIDLDDKIRKLLEQLDQATPAPPAFAELNDYRHSEPSRAVPLTAAAAIVAIGVGGLVAINARVDAPATRPPAASQPLSSEPAGPSAATTGDLLAISLDDWISPSPIDAGQRSWTVLDTAQLPTDIELIEESASVLLASPTDDRNASFAGMADAYEYTATLRANGNEFNVVIGTSTLGHCSSLLGAEMSTTDDSAFTSAPTGEVVDINGERAVIDGTVLCWTVEPGVVASITPTRLSPADGYDGATADLGRRVSFTHVAELPQPMEPLKGDPAPASGNLRGTLNATPWSAAVETSTLRAMWISADGRALGGFSNDRLSQPTDTPATTGELSLTGAPGAGALVYGYVAPEVAGVRVTSSHSETTVLPVLQRENESFVAVPIPEGVVVTTLEFVRADGSVYSLASLGPLPADLVGTYGGLISPSRAPTTAD